MGEIEEVVAIVEVLGKEDNDLDAVEEVLVETV